MVLLVEKSLNAVIAELTAESDVQWNMTTFVCTFHDTAQSPWSYEGDASRYLNDIALKYNAWSTCSPCWSLNDNLASGDDGIFNILLTMMASLKLY